VSILKDLTEKVHTLKNPDIKPKGAPADRARAFDKVHGATGKRPDRSVLKAIARDHQYYSIDGSNEGDYMQVLVMGGVVPDIDIGRKYHGINVLFMADGSVTKSIADNIAQGQWREDKEKIIAAAKKHWKAGTIEAFVKRGGDAHLRGPDDYDNGHNPYSANTPHEARANDYQGESMKPTFKQYLMIEAPATLTAAQKKTLLADFKEWSGGFTPDECPWRGDDEDDLSVSQYIEFALPTDLPQEAAKDFLQKLTEGKKGKFGVKIGGVYTEDTSFGFEDRLNAQKTEQELKDAGIKHTRNANFGIFYFHFDSPSDLKKAVRLARKIIDKSAESEWK
jgi:hypothetical protein